MPSFVVHARVRRAALVGSVACVFVLPGAFLASGCNAARMSAATTLKSDEIPPQVPFASLGNARWGKPPSRMEVELAQFLFGTEPERVPDLIKPVDIAVETGAAIVSDAGRSALLSITATGLVQGISPDPAPATPASLYAAADGDLLVADIAAACVWRFRPNGALRSRYALDSGAALKPSGIVEVDRELWIANAAEHRIEVFESSSGAWLRAIGKRGRGPGEFGLPLGMTRDADGNVLIVDMLAARVQVLDSTGRWLRDIGGPGAYAGYFTRPKDVAVGPDGVVFVADAGSQCIHAFDRNGRALITFGGEGDDRTRLALPGGIAISRRPVAAVRELPPAFEADYYVLVIEQIAEPGVRVYAWRTVTPTATAAALARRAPAFPSSVENPHWRADGCARCHEPRRDNGPGWAPIATRNVDALCVSCHDGIRASAETHPVGWPAAGGAATVPDGWPLVDGRLGCLTCHDIGRHCDPAAVRTAENPAMVRDYDASRPLDFCTRCHTAEQWRVSPHRGLPAGARETAMCGVCHSDTPARSADTGSWENTGLRQPASQVCFNCHVAHADPAPGGHLNLSPLAPVGLPLEDGRITCSSCHNPHAENPPDGTPYTAWATTEEDRRVALRMNYVDLCRECHEK